MKTRNAYTLLSEGWTEPRPYTPSKLWETLTKKGVSYLSLIIGIAIGGIIWKGDLTIKIWMISLLIVCYASMHITENHLKEKQQ